MSEITNTVEDLKAKLSSKAKWFWAERSGYLIAIAVLLVLLLARSASC